MKKFWSLLVPLLLLFGIIASVLFRSLQLCRGHFGYPMDDTYIHMAMAKNFALHGVWGVTRYAFSSSTSSPLYTLFLAVCYLLTGVHEVTPLLLNLVAAVCLAGCAHFILRRAGLDSVETLVALSALVLLMPLAAVVEGGMEHVLHACLTLAFIHFSCIVLTDASRQEKTTRWLIVLSPVLVMTRYEGLFLIFTVAVLFLMQRRWGTSAGLLTAAGIALAGYGIVSVQHGWLPLPNSILLKANLPHGSTQIPGLRLLWNWAIAAAQAPHVAFLLLLALSLLYLSFRRHPTIWNYTSLALIQFVSIGFLHLEFARTGWFYRYEAYLVAAGIVTCAMAFHGLRPLPRSWVLRGGYVCALLAAGTLGFKSFRSMAYGPRAYHNIYEQQYQTALFIGAYYPTDTIVVNDIGAVCFYTEAHVLDVYGLGSMEPARAKLRNDYNTAWLGKWAADNNAAIAILYPKGWAGESFAIPPEWKRAATWTLSDNFVLAGDAVDVLAIQPGVLPRLESNVSNFRSRLPVEIVQSGE